MRALLLVSSALALAACSAPNVSGTWQGSASGLSLRYVITDSNGSLSGSSYAFLSGAWTYTGALSGDHSSWRTNFWDGSGYEVVSGRFADSNTFTGKYRLYYPDGYLAAQADVALSRISAQTTALTAEADPAAAALMSNSLTESVRELIEGDDGPRP